MPQFGGMHVALHLVVTTPRGFLVGITALPKRTLLDCILTKPNPVTFSHPRISLDRVISSRRRCSINRFHAFYGPRKFIAFT